MMKRLSVTVLSLFIFSPIILIGQIRIEGLIYDKHDEPIVGANIFLEGTFSGTSSNVDGSFNFNTNEVGDFKLLARYIGYEEQVIPLFLDKDTVTIQIKMREAINKIDMITITAGTFESGGESKRTILSELDVVTTAGATGDIAGVLNTLPGTQTVGEEGKLYVRGGDDYETQTFIDGLRVINPYHTTIPYTATRNRFSPFMFQGTSFSTGGYSAEYGQGLSSALILSTKEKADQTRTDLTIIPFGAEIAQALAGEKTSLAAKVGYFNMNSYYRVIPQNIDWIKAPESVDANLVLRNKVGKYGILKAYGNFTWSTSLMNYYDIDTPTEKAAMQLDNLYGYFNTSYKDIIGQRWSYIIGASFSSSKDTYSFEPDIVNEHNSGGQFKVAFSGEVNRYIDITAGVDFFQRNHSFLYQGKSDDSQSKLGFGEQIMATFVEADIFFSNSFLARIGLRSEYSWLNHSQEIDPRISLGYKTGSHSDISFAYGQFQQATKDDLLRIANSIENEKSSHYILNYQYKHKSKTFRIEGYYKEYHDLVKYDPQNMYDASSYTNNGEGYAKGVDVFWRDSYGSIKNADYWISYSFLDTERDYRDFPGMAIPIFASQHNISVSYKQFFPTLKSFLSGAYTFASARPYHNPNSDGFNSGRTKCYNDLSATLAYMATDNIGVFLVCTNVLGFENEFGYEYGTSINEEGQYNRRAIVPSAKRLLLLGVTITLSKNGVMNQLKSL
jgi:hypothetical protein